MSKTLEREQYLQSFQRTKGIGAVTLPPEAVDDLKFFGKKAKEGRPITRDGLRKWMLKKYSLNLGRMALYKQCIENGVEPWWRP